MFHNSAFASWRLQTEFQNVTTSRISQIVVSHVIFLWLIKNRHRRS